MAEGILKKFWNNQHLQLTYSVGQCEPELCRLNLIYKMLTSKSLRHHCIPIPS